MTGNRLSPFLHISLPCTVSAIFNWKKTIPLAVIYLFMIQSEYSLSCVFVVLVTSEILPNSFHLIKTNDTLK